MGLLRRFARAIIDRPVRLLLFTWILPVGLMVYTVIAYQQRITNAAFDDFASAAQYSAVILQERANELASSLKRSSYDNTIELAYRRYAEGLISRDEYDDAVSDFMKNAWGDMSRIKYAAYVTNISDHPVGIGDVLQLSINGERFSQSFINKDFPAIMRASEGTAGGVGVYLGGDRELYFFHNLLVNESGGVKNIGVVLFCYDTLDTYNVFDVGNYPQKRFFISINGLPLSMTADGKYELHEWDYTKIPDKPVREGKVVRVGKSFTSIDLKIVYLEEMDVEALTRDSVFYVRVMAIIALMFVVILVYYNLISAPVRRLMKAIGAMELSKLGVRVDLAERSEFRFLFGAFEGMSNRLVALQEQTYKEELAARDAKIDSLTSQINPHFINNLLELISWQARLGDAKGVSHMIDSMVVIMEAAMNRDHLKSVDLAAEVGYANAYLNIIKERYGTKLTVNMELPSPLPTVTLPPLIIQPMLENAVKHGIEPNGGGHITMKIVVETGMLRVDVANSGKQMNDSDKRRARAALSHETYHSSVGLRNIAQRLKLIYGDKANIEMFSEGRETVSRLRVPCVTESSGIILQKENKRD